MIINQNNLTALFRGFKLIFNKAFEGTPSDWQKIAMLVPSSTSQEVYPWLGSITRFRKWVGDRVVQNMKTHSFTIVNESFEDTVGVKKSSIEDDNYGLYNPLIGQLGQDAAAHPDELVFGLLKGGVTGLCYDGQPFFDADHPVLDASGQEASVSNVATGSGDFWCLMDTSKIVKPLIYQKRKAYKFVALDKDNDENVFMRDEVIYGVDARCNVGFGLWQLAFGSTTTLDASNFKAARTAMRSLKGDNGRPLNIKPNLLVVGPGNEDAAEEILEAERNAQGATNVLRGKADLLVTSWLD